MIKLIPDWVYCLVIGALVTYCGWTQIQLARERTNHAVTKQQFAEHQAQAFGMAIKKGEDQKTALADLDSKHTKELSDAKSKIEILASDVRSGQRRLRLNATCTTSAVPQAPGTARVDDAAGPRLDGTAERDYFNLRAGIETATKQIAGLQDYVTNVCLK
jgi:prophage endopeptidase